MPHVIGFCGGISAGKSTLAKSIIEYINTKDLIPFVIDTTKSIKKTLAEKAPYTDPDFNIASQYLLYSTFINTLIDLPSSLYLSEALSPKQNKFVIITTRTPLDHVFYLSELNKKQNTGLDINLMYDRAINFCSKYYDKIIFFGKSYEPVIDKWKFLINSGGKIHDIIEKNGYKNSFSIEDFTDDSDEKSKLKKLCGIIDSLEPSKAKTGIDLAEICVNSPT